MGKGKGGGENSKKAAGNAKKADAAAKKQAELEAQQEAAEQELWSQGSKGKNAKKEDKTAKLEEAKKKKAEREAELEAEMASLPKKPAGNPKKATKASSRPSGSGIDAALASSTSGGELHAHNIDDAIAALELTTGKNSDKVDRHPERRFKSALRAYEEERLPEIRKEHPGLRLNQYQQRIYEEFKKSPENPYNQVKVAFNASRDEVRDTLDGVRQAKEDRLRR